MPGHRRWRGVCAQACASWRGSCQVLQQHKLHQLGLVGGAGRGGAAGLGSGRVGGWAGVKKRGKGQTRGTSEWCSNAKHLVLVR